MTRWGYWVAVLHGIFVYYDACIEGAGNAFEIMAIGLMSISAISGKSTIRLDKLTRICSSSFILAGCFPL